MNKKEYKDKNVYFKLHPNNKKLITFKSKNFYFINKIDTSKRYKVFLSPTTTLIYDFIKIGEEFVGFLGYNPLLDAVSVQLNGEKINIYSIESFIENLDNFQFIEEIKSWSQIRDINSY